MLTSCPLTSANGVHLYQRVYTRVCVRAHTLELFFKVLFDPHKEFPT